MKATVWRFVENLTEKTKMGSWYRYGLGPSSCRLDEKSGRWRPTVFPKSSKEIF